MSDQLLICTFVFLIFLILKIPVFLAILSATVLYFTFIDNLTPLIIAQRCVAGLENIPLLAIPFFIFAGVLMNYTGITRRMMNFCTVVTGRMDGGLAQANVLLSTIMGGVSGSSIADAAMEAKIFVPEMEKKGMSKPFSSVITAASAIITPLIPPGIGMIVYGSVTGVSIGKLFVAGFGAGILLYFALNIYVRIVSRRRGYKRLRETKITRKEFVTAFKPAMLALCFPVIILGGIRLGVFTPTEAGSIAVIFALALGMFYREMTIKDFLNSIKESTIATANIMIIIGMASAFAWILTREFVPQRLTMMMLQFTDNKYLFLVMINLLLLLIGMFMEGNATIIVLAPLLHPIAQAYGIDDINFAMVVIFNISLGMITPPFGMLMFTTCGITGCKVKDFLKEGYPVIIVLFLCLVIITFVPWVTTGLVELIF